MRYTWILALIAILLTLGAGCTGQQGAADAATDASGSEAVATSQEGRPEDTEVWEPEPPVVTPGLTETKSPTLFSWSSDARVLMTQ